MAFDLGNELVAATVKLEKFFYDEFREIYENHEKTGEKYKLTLGNSRFAAKLKKRLPGKAYSVFTWFVEKRNAYIHHGDRLAAENDKVRSELNVGDFSNVVALITILVSLNRTNEKVGEDWIHDWCENHLSPMVYDEMFRKQPAAKQQGGYQGGNGASPSLAPQSTTIQPRVPVGSSALDLLHDARKRNLGGERQRKETDATVPEVISGPKLVNMKPPILIPALAACLGIQPFNIMADLIKLGVFPAPNQPLEPEIAAKVCEIHGFTFEHK